MRGDAYWTGSNVDATIVLPDLVDSSGTDQQSTLINEMTSENYARIRLTKNNGKTMVIDKTKIRVVQRTESNVGNLDPWELRLYDVDTSGIFNWS